MNNKRKGALAALILVCGLHPSALFAQASSAALRFYGTGTSQQDRVRIAIDDDAPGPDASAPCDVGAGSFTIDFWLRGLLAENNSSHNGGDVESFDFNWINGNIVVDRDIYDGSEADWGVSVAGGYVRFGTGRGQSAPLDSDNTIEGNVNVLDGQWHHVAVVRNAATGAKSIHVDGQLDFASSPGASLANISYPNNGAPGQQTPWGPYIVLAAEKHDAGPAYPSFSGYMDEFRVWNVGLSAAQIAEVYDQVIAGDTPGLVACYRFEEGAGTTVSDSSAAGSPAGLLIAGAPGNGEWVTYAADPNNTAPVSGVPLPIPAVSDWGVVILCGLIAAAGSAMVRRGIATNLRRRSAKLETALP